MLQIVFKAPRPAWEILVSACIKKISSKKKKRAVDVVQQNNTPGMHRALGSVPISETKWGERQPPNIRESPH